MSKKIYFDILIIFIGIFVILLIGLIMHLTYNLFFGNYTAVPNVHTILNNETIYNKNNNSISFTLNNQTTISNDLTFSNKDKTSIFIIIALIVLSITLIWIINRFLKTNYKEQPAFVDMVNMNEKFKNIETALSDLKSENKNTTSR